jgi:hypothetical protein
MVDFRYLWGKNKKYQVGMNLVLFEMVSVCYIAYLQQYEH